MTGEEAFWHASTNTPIEAALAPPIEFVYVDPVTRESVLMFRGGEMRAVSLLSEASAKARDERIDVEWAWFHGRHIPSPTTPPR